MTLKLAVGVQHLLSKGCDISCDKLQLHVKHNVFVFCVNEVAIPVADSEMSIVSVILKRGAFKTLCSLSRGNNITLTKPKGEDGEVFYD